MVELAWPSRTGYVYDVQTSSDLINWTVATPDLGANPPENTQNVSIIAGESNYFRIVERVAP